MREKLFEVLEIVGIIIVFIIVMKLLFWFAYESSWAEKQFAKNPPTYNYWTPCEIVTINDNGNITRYYDTEFMRSGDAITKYVKDENGYSIQFTGTTVSLSCARDSRHK
jgi:hypothetical protein